MSRLERLLSELAAEVERLQGRAPGSDKTHDLTTLTDEELERVEELVTRDTLARGAPAGRRHRPGADEGRRGWACGCEVCALAEDERPAPLTDAEQEELAGLLQKARSGEPGEGES